MFGLCLCALVQADFALIWTNCATYCAHAAKEGNIDPETSVALPEQAGVLFEYVKTLVEEHQEKARMVALRRMFADGQGTCCLCCLCFVLFGALWFPFVPRVLTRRHS